MIGKLRAIDSGMLSALFVVLAIALGASYYVNVRQDADRADCQARYNAAVSTQITERSRLSEASDNAQSAVLLGVGQLIATPPSTDPKVQAERNAQFQQLFRDFKSISDQLAEDRARVRLPAFPNC